MAPKSINFVGPMSPTSRNGNGFILIVSDYFTKWVEAIPFPSKCTYYVTETLFKVMIIIE